MFTFTKKQRGKRDLLAALEVLLIGRKDDREDVKTHMSAKIDKGAADVAEGANAYLIACKVIEGHIIKQLDAAGKEQRLEMLKRISDRRFKEQLPLFELIAHVNYCMTVLQDEEKPLVPPGSAEAFLTEICKWFADNEKLLARVQHYFDEATQHHRAHLHHIKRMNQHRMRVKRGA